MMLANNFECSVYDSGGRLIYPADRLTGIISDEQENKAQFLSLFKNVSSILVRLYIRTICI